MMAFYPTLWSSLLRQRYGTDPTAFQHLELANSFIPIIANTLAQMDNFSQSPEYYNDMAWGGLVDTGTFDIKFPPGTPERVRVIAINQVEDQNITAGLNTIAAGLITPKSLPCY